MLFWQRTLPVLITFVFGIALVLQYYVPHPASESFLQEISVWNQIIAGFAIVLGVGSLLSTHYLKNLPCLIHSPPFTKGIYENSEGCSIW